MSFLTNQSLNNLGTETAFAVLAQTQKRIVEGHDMISLSVGQPDFPTPDHIVKAAHKALDDGHFGYSLTKGIVKLRDIIAAYVEKHWHWSPNPENIIVTAGGKPTIFFACMVLGGIDRHIIIPNPGFPIYHSAANYSGAHVTSYGLYEKNNFSFDADEILNQITDKTSLLVLNSPGNPTGGCFGTEELKRLADGLRQYPNVVILCDEIYRFMCYAPHQHHSLLDFEDLRSRIILLDGCSKTFAMTGWRIGFGIWPEALIPHVDKLTVNSYSCVNNIAQYAAMEAFSGDMSFFDDMLAEFKRRRDLLVDGLNDIDGVQCALPSGAFYAFANFTNVEADDHKMQQKLMTDANIATVAGSDFGDVGKGYIRFSYAAAYDDIARAIERIKKIC